MDANNTSQYIYETTVSDPGVNAAIIAGLVGFFLFFALLTYVITSFLLGKIFQKAGEPQWAAWVPIYNNWKLLQLGDQQGFWAVLALIPFVNIISMIFIYIAMYHIGRKLGKEGWFVLLAIFFPIVWMIWLAFDSSRWPKQKSEAAPTAKQKSAKKAAK